MQIHVVRPGETVQGIAQSYGVSPGAIETANGLAELPHLVVGQALVIPVAGRTYRAQGGERLDDLARRFGVSPQTLARVNRISRTAPLRAGATLYIPPGPKRRAEINAYVEPAGGEYSPEILTDVRRVVPHLTYLAPFSYRVKRDGTLEELPLDNLPALARDAGASLVLAVTNQEQGRFSAELGSLILEDQTVQTRLLNDVMQTARRHGFRDIHFDFEYLRPADREAYNRFLRRAADRVHREGLMISTALAPKTGPEQRGAWYEAHDYPAHGRIVDFVVIMTYEWGYSGGPPQAVSPIGPVRRVLQYAASVMNPGKIMMGQNLYGYDWTLPFVRGRIAQALSPQGALKLAAEQGVAVEYDETAQAPYFDYTDDQRRRHRVWFEDARSIQAKIDLVEELRLRGISYWKLGLSFPQNWQLIEANFTVVKHGG